MARPPSPRLAARHAETGCGSLRGLAKQTWNMASRARTVSEGDSAACTYVNSFVTMVCTARKWGYEQDHSKGFEI